MNKSNILFDKTFLIISLILIVIVAGGLFYFNQHNFPADAVAIIDFQGQELIVNASTIMNIEQVAAQQNVTLNRTLVIERLVQLKVLEAQAKHLNIEPTQEQVDAAVSQQLATLETQGLDEALVEQNLTRESFIESLRSSVVQDLTLQLLFNQEVVSKLQVSDEQLIAAYTENPTQFTVPESVSVKHILICYEGAPLCSLNLTKEQAQQSIVAVYQALQNNASFEELASRFSTDTGSAQRGGDIGQVAKGQTVPEFEVVAFETPVGMMSMPFETPYGFHILAVYGKQAAQKLTLEQVAPQLRQQLILQQANVLQQAYINGLMSGAKVTIVG